MKAEQILKNSQKETPYYAYDLGVLRQTLSKAKSASSKLGYHIHYAIKANAQPRILAEVKACDFGVDCVSGQELQHALDHGFSPKEIAFAGVGKSNWEIDLALSKGIFTLNVESLEELEVVNERASNMGLCADVAIRLNPDVNAKTHHYITTGLEENKFGIGSWQIPTLIDRLHTFNHVNLIGLHFHIGSQIQSLEPFRNLCNRINEFQSQFADYGIQVSHVNAGGGLGIDYQNPGQYPDFDSYFSVFDQFLELRPHQKLHFELGRALVANCADLVSQILYIKNGQKTNFMILDAGMTELMRPALYQAFHKIENITSLSNELTTKYDVVGPICESSDCFGKSILLPKSSRGDTIVIRSAGAYGECMANEYNMRKLNAPLFYI